MVCRHTALVRRKTAVEQQLIGTVTLRITPAVLTIERGIGVDVVEYQLLNSRRAKGYGRLHPLALKESINTC